MCIMKMEKFADNEADQTDWQNMKTRASSKCFKEMIEYDRRLYSVTQEQTISR